MLLPPAVSPMSSASFGNHGGGKAASSCPPHPLPPPSATIMQWIDLAPGSSMPRILPRLEHLDDSVPVDRRKASEVEEMGEEMEELLRALDEAKKELRESPGVVVQEPPNPNWWQLDPCSYVGCADPLASTR